MLAKSEMERLNFLAKKKKTIGLTPAETAEQTKLRQAYLKAFRTGFAKHIEGIKVVDEAGNDLTSERVKAIQRATGLHQRGSEEDEA